MRYKRKRAEREATPCQRDNDMFVYGGRERRGEECLGRASRVTANVEGVEPAEVQGGRLSKVR